MINHLRKPAWTPPPVVVADAWQEDPSPSIQAWFTDVQHSRMAGLPFLNPRLEVEVLDMGRVRGDWLGALITPWSIQLVLLPGGGELWSDLAAGCRHSVTLPAGEVPFLADAGEEGLKAYQYCALTTTVESFSDMAAAREFARDALKTALTAPEPPAAEGVEDEPAVDLSRRGLLGLRRRRGDG